MRDRIFEAAREAGRDPAEITCVYNLDIRIDDNPVDEPGVVSGPADQVVDRLLGFRALGFTAMNFCPSGPDPAEQAERLAREVVPAVRAS